MTVHRMALIGALAAGTFAFMAADAGAKEYILTAVKPNKLVLVDGKARKVERVYDVPNAAPGIFTITPSPDSRIAYALVNRWESISGIDLDSGKEVFRADMSTDAERVKVICGMDVTPDGKEIAVYQSPVKLGRAEYEVQPTRIAIYDTGSGINAKPVRTFEAPRQLNILMYSTDGSKLYALGRALYVFDPKTGEQIAKHETQNWDRENFFPPDILDFWHQFEQANVFSTPYFTARSDMDLANPEAWWIGMLTLDLASGEFKMEDMTYLDVFYFSTVVNPVRRNEAYGVYLSLGKFDLEAKKRVDDVPLDHAYYAINVAGDGSEIYAAGTMSDIAVYNTETLEKIGQIEMPGDASMAISAIRMIDR